MEDWIHREAEARDGENEQPNRENVGMDPFVRRLLGSVCFAWLAFFAGTQFPLLLQSEIGQNLSHTVLQMVNFTAKETLLLGYFEGEEYTKVEVGECERYHEKHLIVSYSAIEKIARNVGKVSVKRLFFKGTLTDEFRSLLEPSRRANRGKNNEGAPDRNSYYLGNGSFFQMPMLDRYYYTEENKFQNLFSDFNNLINIEISQKKLCDEISKLRIKQEKVSDDCMIVVGRLYDYILFLTYEKYFLTPKCFKGRVQRILLVSDQEYPSLETAYEDY